LVFLKYIDWVVILLHIVYPDTQCAAKLLPGQSWCMYFVTFLRLCLCILFAYLNFLLVSSLC